MEGKVLVCENCFHDYRHENQWPGSQVHGHYTIPMKSGDTVVGVLNLYTSAGVQNSTQREVLLALIGNKLGEAFHTLPWSEAVT